MTKTYSGTLQEQLSAYRADRCAIDVLFKNDCEAARFPPPSAKKVPHD